MKGLYSYLRWLCFSMFSSTWLLPFWFIFLYQVVDCQKYFDFLAWGNFSGNFKLKLIFAVQDCCQKAGWRSSGMGDKFSGCVRWQHFYQWLHSLWWNCWIYSDIWKPVIWNNLATVNHNYIWGSNHWHRYNTTLQNNTITFIDPQNGNPCGNNSQLNRKILVHLKLIRTYESWHHYHIVHKMRLPSEYTTSHILLKFMRHTHMPLYTHGNCQKSLEKWSLVFIW